MTNWPTIPSDAIDWIREVFLTANRATSEAILNVPSIRETSLDDVFVQALVPRSAPKLLPSGALVRMDVHNIGGLRRFGGWEIADIGVIVFVIRAERIIARKVALLQAKRLYPANKDVEDEDPVGFQYGMNRFLRYEGSPTSMTLLRSFRFDKTCQYAALRAGADQVKAIDQFTKRMGHEVYYLFYNPPTVPLEVRYPIAAIQALSDPPEIGCRVLTTSAVHGVTKKARKGSSPTFAQISAAGDSNGGWRVEYWAADLLLNCKVGRAYEENDESVVLPLLERRSGPIGAAIAVSIELPSES